MFFFYFFPFFIFRAASLEVIKLTVSKITEDQYDQIRSAVYPNGHGKSSMDKQYDKMHSDMQALRHAGT